MNNTKIVSIKNILSSELKNEHITDGPFSSEILFNYLISEYDNNPKLKIIVLSFTGVISITEGFISELKNYLESRSDVFYQTDYSDLSIGIIGNDLILNYKR